MASDSSFSLLYHIPCRLRIWQVPAFILSFFIATIHEVATLGWMTLLAGWVFWLWVEKSENSVLKRFLIVGFLAAGLGLIVMFLSPGIDNRAAVQHYPGTTPIIETIQIAVRNFFEFFRIIPYPYYAHEAGWQPGWLLLAGMLGIGWVVDFPIQRNWKAAGFVVLLTGAMIYVSLVPAAYVYRGNIPLRSQMIPSFYLTMGAFMLGTVIPKIKNDAITNSILFFIMVAVALGMRIVVPQMLRPMDALEQYAADWDARDLKFQKSSGVPPDIYVPWDEYEQNMNCVQRYYTYLRQVNEKQN